MVKRIFISILIFSIAVFSGNISHSRKLTIYRPFVRYMYDIKDISHLEEVSEAIVKARVLWQSRQHLTYMGDAQDPSLGHTITKVIIVKVYKSCELVDNQVISIIEPYFTCNNHLTGDQNLCTLGNYKPLERNRTYILFIKKYTGKDKKLNEEYSLIRCEYGKYRLSNKFNGHDETDSFTASDFDLYKPDPKFEKIFFGVMKKYK